MFCERQHTGSCKGLPVLPGCCPGQLLFCDSSGNLDVHQPHLSLVAQIKLARKWAMMTWRVDVHQGYPSLPREVSDLLLLPEEETRFLCLCWKPSWWGKWWLETPERCFQNLQGIRRQKYLLCGLSHPPGQQQWTSFLTCAFNQKIKAHNLPWRFPYLSLSF